MSEENLEIVRQVYEAAARRDTATILTLDPHPVGRPRTQPSKGAP